MCQMQTRRVVGAKEIQGRELKPRNQAGSRVRSQDSGGPILAAGNVKSEVNPTRKQNAVSRHFSPFRFHFQWQLEFPLARWIEWEEWFGGVAN